MKTIILLSFVLALTHVVISSRVVCYWPNVSSDGPESIDASLCTHIHYAFAKLDETYAPIDSIGYPNEAVYKRLNNLKAENHNLKVILAVGGGGNKLSPMAANANLRAKFVKQTIDYLQKYDFDGMDLDWEYPVCWEVDCTKAKEHAADKQNYILLLKDLHEAFQKQNPKLSLSAAVNGGDYIGKKAYDFNAIGRYLDYINVMTYDVAGAWDGHTGHHSPFEWCKRALAKIVNEGVPKNKLLMGVPFYARGFILQDPNKHGLNAPIKGGFEVDKYTQICQDIRSNGWHKEQSRDGHDPIAYKGDRWICYDDANQAYQKGKFIKDNGYGGILIWNIDQDDIKAQCSRVTHPLLRAVNHGLFGTQADPSTYGCE